MQKGKINFFTEDIVYKIKQKRKLGGWIRNTIETEGQKLSEINFIFCNDNYLLEINQQYLKHSSYTDIITFDNSEIKGSINGDIYISIERVKENASVYDENVQDELHRIMIHGVLHLLGYKDKPKKNKVLMTGMENKYLVIRNF